MQLLLRETPVVRNTGLGRGLGQLMDSRPQNGTANGSSSTNGKSSPPTPPVMSAGVRILISGTPAPAATLPAKPRVGKSLLIGLFVADVLLCALASRLVLLSDGRPSWFTWALAITALGVGCWLAWQAVSLKTQNAATNSVAAGESVKAPTETKPERETTVA
jgi:hypothetical protein